MCANERPNDPHFHQEEYLFRRVPTLIWEDPASDFDVDAVELPDLSVGRSKHGHAEWVRFDVINHRFYEDWGVVAVQVQDIPPMLWKDGVAFAFRVQHSPLELDYPHSEICAFEGERHLQEPGAIPPGIDLEWRERLLRRLHKIIKPYQRVVVRERAPISHKLEPHIVCS